MALTVEQVLMSTQIAFVVKRHGVLLTTEKGSTLIPLDCLTLVDALVIKMAHNIYLQDDEDKGE